VILRISRTVTRGPSRTGDRRARFQYRNDCLLGEDIVLRRWRERSQSPRAMALRETFDGFRLKPGTWRALQACRSAGLRLDRPVNLDDLTLHLEAARVLDRDLRAPQAGKFVPLITYLQSRKLLAKVVNRPRIKENPGLPDLFLYRRAADGSVYGSKFLEVKLRIPAKHYIERVSAEQAAEIAFLRSLGLKAGVVYLVQTS
jgi:hypothetical protein